MDDGLVDLPVRGQDEAEVIVGLRVPRPDLERLLELNEDVVDLAAVTQYPAEVAVGLRVVGLDHQRLPKKRNRLVARLL